MHPFSVCISAGFDKSCHARDQQPGRYRICRPPEANTAFLSEQLPSPTLELPAWSHSTCSSLSASSGHTNAFETHPYCCCHHSFVPFHCWVVFSLQDGSCVLPTPPPRSNSVRLIKRGTIGTLTPGLVEKATPCLLGFCCWVFFFFNWNSIN